MRKLKRGLALLLALALLPALAISEEAMPAEAAELAAEEPVDEGALVEEPVEEEPVAGEPAGEEPVEEEPAEGEPVVEEPIEEEPSEEEPAEGEAEGDEPVIIAPVAEESTMEPGENVGEASPEIFGFESADAAAFEAEGYQHEVAVLKREGSTANSAKLEQVLCDELELTRFDGSVIQYIGFADYDGDGKGEAFAYVKHTPKEVTYTTIYRLYFVTENAVKKLYPLFTEDALQNTLNSGNFKIWDLGNRCLFYAEIYNTILDKGMIWAVEKGKTSNITDQFPDAEVKHLSGNVFLCTFSVQDFGHKYVPKYFYYYKDKKIKEYGGKYITKKEFLEYAGSQKLIREAASKGYTLENIIYRSCGFIHLTFTKKDANGIRTSWFYTVSYDDTSIKRYDEGEGSYQMAHTKNATAPKAFKHPNGISKVEVNAPKTTLNLNENLQLTTALTPAIADTTLNWKSSNAKVATVDENGRVTAKGEGKAKITVTSGNKKTSSVKVEVVDPYKPTGVELDRSGTVELHLNNSLTLRATLQPASAQSDLSWKSSDKKIATVENGVVKAVREGKVTITVTTAKKNAKGKKMSASVKVKVVDPYKPTGVELDRSGTVELDMSNSLTLRATLQPASAQSDLTWKSSNKKIATVENGVVKPIKEGKVTITVTTVKKNTKGKKMSATVKVKVVNVNRPIGIALENQAKITLEVGESKQLIPTLTPSTAVTGLTWTTSAKKYVTVDQQGWIKGIRKGEATIYVKTYNGKTAKCTVTVKKATNTTPSHPEPSAPQPPKATATPPAVDPGKW